MLFAKPYRQQHENCHLHKIKMTGCAACGNAVKIFETFEEEPKNSFCNPLKSQKCMYNAQGFIVCSDSQQGRGSHEAHIGTQDPKTCPPQPYSKRV